MFPFLSGQPVGLGSDRPREFQNLRTAFVPLPRWDFKEPGRKCDNVSLRAAAETVKAPAELQAGRVLIVEGT